MRFQTEWLKNVRKCVRAVAPILPAFVAAAMIQGPVWADEPDSSRDGEQRGKPRFSQRDGGPPFADRGPRRGGPEGFRHEGPGRPGHGPGHGKSGDRRPMGRPPLHAALDRNGDGVISSEEIENASSALRRLDRNDDGQIDFAELRPQRPEGDRRAKSDGDRMARRDGRGGPPPWRGGVREGDRRGGSDRGRPAERGDFRRSGDKPGPERPEARDGDRPGPRDRDSMRRRFDQGGRFDQGDRPGPWNGRPRRERMIERLMQLDEDGNGSLSRQELETLGGGLRPANDRP